MLRENDVDTWEEAAYEDTSEAGIHSFVPATNLLYGDTLVASLFGLDPVETAKGLKPEIYLARIHPDDRERTRRLIQEAIAGGRTYYNEYRVSDGTSRYQMVIGLGRCFRDDRDTPVVFSGIVYPLIRL